MRSTDCFAADRVLIAGHRGESSRAPENTIPAFVGAIRAGCELVEMDYHHSADGVPMVIHDETTDRTTDSKARWGKEKVLVAHCSATELATLDAGSWYSPKFQGVRIPPLDTVLDVLRGSSIPLIERKAGDAATIVHILKEKGLIARAIVQAFDWAFLAECRRLAPELVLGALGEDALDDAYLAKAKEFGAGFLGWNERDLTAENVRRARRAGLAVWTWTVDDPERAHQLASFGVSAITSNCPAIIRRQFAR